MKNKKTFTRKKSPEQQEAELIMEELEKERMLHALEVEDVPIRLTAELNDSGDRVHMTTTNKTKYIICTVESDGLEIFDMIDDDVHNDYLNLQDMKAFYDEFNDDDLDNDFEE